MKKAVVLNLDGSKKRELELPECFSGFVRNDLILKVHEAMKHKQPYAPFILAGMQASASGIIKHARRKWKTAYGYGISRVPRKIFSRRGSRFSWQAATIASARKGRQAHPPKVEAMQKFKSINKKEKKLALKSAIAATSSAEILKKKYPKIKEINFPLIFDSAITQLKTKELIALIKKFLPYNNILIILGSKEGMKAKIFDTARANMLSLKQLSDEGSPGKLAIYTENAIEEMRSLK